MFRLLFFSLIFIFSCSDEKSDDQKVVDNICSCYSKMNDEILAESNFAWQKEFYTDAIRLIQLEYTDLFLVDKILSGIDWMSLHERDPEQKDMAEKVFRGSVHLLHLLSDDIYNLDQERKLLEVKKENRYSSYFVELREFTLLLRKHYRKFRFALEKKRDQKLSVLINTKGREYYLNTYQLPEDLHRKKFDFYARVNEILFPYLEEAEEFNAKEFNKALQKKCGMRFW